MAYKVTATRFGGVSSVGTDGSVRAEVEYWLLTDDTKHGRFSTTVPHGHAGTPDQITQYMRTAMSTFLNTKYAPLQFGSGDVMIIGF